MKSIIDKAIKKIEEVSMINKGDKIILGCSGGPDSVFLLEVLLTLREEYNLEIILAHINHLYRGEEAKSDENFVKALGEKHQLEVYIKEENMEEYAKKNNLSLEEAGREIRYSFFREVMKITGGNKVALGHNLDDQIETFLFRLIRGSSLEGLEGIQDIREYIIRPINEIYKKEIVEYLNKNSLEYKEDRTNLEKDYTRNSIRLDLIPFIEERYNPKFKDKIVSFMKETREVNKLLSKDYSLYISDNVLEIEKVLEEENYIAKKIINYYLNINNVKTSREKINNILMLLKKGGTKEVKLNKELRLVKEYDKLLIKSIKDKNENIEEIELIIPGKCKFGKYEIEAREIEEKEIINEEYFLTNLKLGDKLNIRGRKEGDRILLKGMNSHKKVKDIFVNDKIPKEKREEIPIILHENREIVWIVGVRKSSIYSQKEKNQRNIVLIMKKMI